MHTKLCNVGQGQPEREREREIVELSSVEDSIFVDIMRVGEFSGINCGHSAILFITIKSPQEQIRPTALKTHRENGTGVPPGKQSLIKIIIKASHFLN